MGSRRLKRGLKRAFASRGLKPPLYEQPLKPPLYEQPRYDESFPISSL
jgi:hypothetical protein